MAKKLGPDIRKEKSKTGIKLTLKPFLTEKLADVEITTEIAAVQSGRAPLAKTWFTGVPFTTPLSTVDVITWIEAMRAMQDEARKVIEKMKP
jgi:hypothetical protein